MRTFLIIAAGCAASAFLGCSKSAPGTDANRARAHTPCKYLQPIEVMRILHGRYEFAEEMPLSGLVLWSTGTIVAVERADLKGDSAESEANATETARQHAVLRAVRCADDLRVDSRGVLESVLSGSLPRDMTAVPCRAQSTWREKRLTYDSPKFEPIEIPQVWIRIQIPLYGKGGLARLGEIPIPRPPRRRNLEDPEPAMAEPDLIIVDARGTSFEPCLLPCVVDEQGRSIFHPSDIPHEDLAERHVATYVTALRSDDRDLDSPAPNMPESPDSFLQRAVLLRAARPPPGNPAEYQTQIVLTEAEVRRLSRYPNLAALFEAGRLVIVIDRAYRHPVAHADPGSGPTRDTPGLHARFLAGQARAPERRGET